MGSTRYVRFHDPRGETELPNVVGQTIGNQIAGGIEQARQGQPTPDLSATVVPQTLLSADTSQVQLQPPIDPNQTLQQIPDYQNADALGGGGYATSSIPALPNGAATYLDGPGTYSSSAQEVTVGVAGQLVPDGKYGGAFTLSSTNSNGIATRPAPRSWALSTTT